MTTRGRKSSDPSRTSSPVNSTLQPVTVSQSSTQVSSDSWTSRTLSVFRRPFRSHSQARVASLYPSSSTLQPFLPSSKPVPQIHSDEALSSPSLIPNISTAGINDNAPLATAIQISKAPPIPLPLVQSLPQKSDTPQIKTERYTIWRQAFNSLTSEDQQQLNQFDIHDCLKKMREATEQKKKDCDDNRWTYSVNGEDIVLRDIADKIIHWIDRFKAIGDTIVQYDPVHAALPWAGFRFLLEVATADSKKQGSILVGIESLANLVDRCAIYECLYLGDPNTRLASAETLEEVLVCLYADILTYLSKSKRYYSHNTAARLAIAIAEADLEPLMANIKNGEEGAHKAAEIVNMDFNKYAHRIQSEEQRRLRQILLDLEKPIHRMDFRISDLHKNLEASRHSRILEWICTVPYMGHHKRVKQDRLGSSGNWFLEKKEFTDWRGKSTSSLLWLHGIPGAGKTKLVSLVVDTLIEAKAAGSREALAFFYCNRNEPERRTPESILRAFVKQLSSLEPGSRLLQPTVEKYKEEESKGFVSGLLDLDECCDLIIKLLSSYSQSNIVIDALDECHKETRSKLISALDTIMKSSPSLVKVFISSREDDDIFLKLRELPNLRISAKDNSADIERFVHTEIDRRITEKDLLRGQVSKDLRGHVIDTLIKGADGMFMWVDLQIKTLCDSDRLHTESDVRETLRKLPKGLIKTYSQILQTILSYPKQSKSLAIKTLKWIMCARRPLSPSELITAISVQVQPSDDDVEGLELDKEMLLRLCHNLVIWDSELDVMRFAHLSVLEFLEVPFKITDAHAMAAEFCLHILCLPNRQGQQESMTYPLDKLPYWVENWAYHIPLCGHQPRDSNIFLLQTRFFHVSTEPSNAYLKWVETLKKFGFNYELYESTSSPLSTAVYYKLTESVKYLLGLGGVDINGGGGGETPLCIATNGGSETLVRLLLENRANPNHSGLDGQTAIFKAATNGNRSMLKLLLENGANVNHINKKAWNPLHKAVMKGQMTAAQLLLENGANVEQKRGDKETVISVAARKGHIALVKMLLNYGADKDNRDGYGKTAMNYAIDNGFTEIVKLLNGGEVKEYE